MTAANLSLDIKQGATFRRGFTWKNKLKKPIDLTGCGARLQIRNAAGTLLADLTTENGGIVLGGLLGTVDLFIPDEATELMDMSAPGLYDLFVDHPNGDVTPLLTGSVKFIKGQVRRV
jgi:hypothetical protein